MSDHLADQRMRGGLESETDRMNRSVVYVEKVLFESRSVDRKDDIFGDVGSLFWSVLDTWCTGGVAGSVHREPKTFKLKAKDLRKVFFSLI
jgi:hypothetical protein